VGSKGTEGQTQSNPGEASASRATWKAEKRTARAGLKAAASWIAEHELWLLAVVVPVLMASNRVPPTLTLVAMLLIPVPWLCRLVAKGYLTVHTPMDIPIILLLFTVIVSLYASVDLPLSMLGVHKIIAEIALFYGLVNGVRSEKRIWLVTSLLLIAGSVASIASLVVMPRPSSKLLFANPFPYSPRLVEGLAPPNANYVAGTLVLFFPLAFSLLLFGPKKVYKPLAGLSFLITGFTIISTQSRSALSGVVIALLLLAVWRSRWFLLGIPVLAGVGWVLVQRVGIEELMGPLTFMGTAVNSLQARLELWQRAIYIMQDFPYTGISIGTFDSVINVMYPLFLIGPDAVVFHAHNLYLQTGAEFGIPGLIAYLGLLTAFILTTWAILRSSASGRGFRAIAIGLLCGLIAHLLYGLTDAIVLANKTGTFIWAAFGLAVAIRRVIAEHPIAALDAEFVAGGKREHKARRG